MGEKESLVTQWILHNGAMLHVSNQFKTGKIFKEEFYSTGRPHSDDRDKVEDEFRNLTGEEIYNYLPKKNPYEIHTKQSQPTGKERI